MMFREACRTVSRRIPFSRLSAPGLKTTLNRSSFLLIPPCVNQAFIDGYRLGSSCVVRGAFGLGFGSVWTLPVRGGCASSSTAYPVGCNASWGSDFPDGNFAQSSLLGENVRRVASPAIAGRRHTGRSTNGRSRDFESLCLGSNPSRPTRTSTPDATSFRVLWRQQLAAGVEWFLVRSNMADE